jgi:predicted dehydrogenase
MGIALVGLGAQSLRNVGPLLANPLLANHPACRISALVSRDASKAQAYAKAWSIDRSHVYDYDSFDRIVADEAIDIVYLAVPTGMHCELAVRAAKAGKHVFCEKPMATSSEECRQMIAACSAQNRHLGIGYRCQFEPRHMRCMEIAREKQMGGLTMIEAGFGFKIGQSNQWRLRKSLAGGGALMDVGIYALQACRYLTREEPQAIIAQETKTDADKFAEVDESITWTMRFPSGVLAHCSTSYNFNGLNRFRVHAENGWFGMDPAFSYNDNRLETSRGSITLPETDQFATELDQFASCIRENRSSRVSGEEGLKDLLAIEAIYRSIPSQTLVATHLS